MADVEDILCGSENRQPPEDIVDLLYKGCWNNGLHTFLIKPESDARVSYKELFQKSVSLAHFFHAFGARQNQVVAIFSADSLEAGASVLATFFVGATAALIPAESNLEEVIRILLITNPCLIYCDYEAQHQVKEAMTALKLRVKVISPRAFEPFVDFYSLLEFDSTGYKTVVPVEPERHCLVVLFVRNAQGKTSSVMLTNSTVKKWVYGVKDCWNISGLTLLIKSQTTLASGLCFFLAAILGCCTLVKAEDDSSESILKAMCDHEVNFAFMSPESLLALADFPILAHYDLCKLKQIATSGTNMTPNQQLYLIDKLCQSRIPLVQSYGFSDTGLLLLGPQGQRKYGSPGKCGGVRFAKVIDKDSEYYNTLQSNESRYFQEWSSPAGLLLDSSGWMLIGDMVDYNDVGWVFVVKRIIQAINKNKDKQVGLDHFEDVFQMRFPAAFEVVIVRQPNGVGGERPIAFVSRPDGVHLWGQDLMKYMLARAIEHAQLNYESMLVDALPKMPSNNVSHRLAGLQV